MTQFCSPVAGLKNCSSTAAPQSLYEAGSLTGMVRVVDVRFGCSGYYGDIIECYVIWLSNDGNVNMVRYYGDIVKVCCHDKVMIAL
jgi:hypothetical protein